MITLPKTVSPKTVSKRLDLSFGIFARRGEKYSCYGNIEFHFGDGELVHIYSDHFPHEKLHGGRHIALKRRLLSRVKKLSLLSRVKKLSLPRVIRWLNRRGIDFVKQSDKLGIRLYLQSGVELYFENDSGRPDWPRRFKITAFCRKNGGANRYPVIRRLTGGE